jgi:hypothetical protein
MKKDQKKTFFITNNNHQQKQLFILIEISKNRITENDSGYTMLTMI